MLTDLEATLFLTAVAIVAAVGPRVSEAFMVLTYFSAG